MIEIAIIFRRDRYHIWEQNSMQAHLVMPLQPHRPSSMQSSTSTISSSLKQYHFLPIRMQDMQCPQFYPCPKCATTPTSLQVTHSTYLQLVFIRSVNGKGTNHVSFVSPFFTSSQVNRLRWMLRNFGRLLIKLNFLASTNQSHLLHLNLSPPIMSSGTEQFSMQ